jgi:UDP-N-acetylglucosamine 4,6-dehydratase
VASWLKGKRILVTGGAGAFGQKFLKVARESGAAHVTVLSRDEMKHAAQRREWGKAVGEWLTPMIGDVTQPESLAVAMRGIDCVIHAAAMKHLPECEFNGAASTRVNVDGTRNVVNAFVQSAAETLVFLSTDKAPYATSIYGAQKYIGEKLVAEANQLAPGKRAFSLRYSNVMDSTGSVFHIFNQTLAADRAASVNGAGTCRGFVSQARVIACIEKALEVARGGELFVLVPQVVKIAELAETMRELIGKGKVNVTQSTGFLGEKESATLVMAEETALAREAPEFTLGRVVLLDPLARHGERPAAKGIGPKSFTLEDCATMGGAELKTFVAALM